MGRGATQQEWHSYGRRELGQPGGGKLVEALTGNISATHAKLRDMSNGRTQFHAQMVKLTTNDRCPLWE